MLDPLSSENKPYLDALSKKRKIAFITLGVEKLYLHCWRLFFWILLFLGLYMLNLPSFFGQVASFFTATIFYIGVLYFIKKDILSFRLPRGKILDKALEKQSSLPQGHISILDDELSNPRKHETRELWNYAQNEVLHSIKQIKLPRAKAVLTRQDPSALRFIAVLIFFAGIIVSGSQWQERLSAGLLPVTPSYIVSQGKKTNLWVKPPEYTRLGQTHLIGNGVYDKTLNIAEGSKIRIRLHNILGKFFPPIFYNGDKQMPMNYIGEGLYGIEDIISAGNSLIIKQGYITRSRWDYNFIKDTPPEISIFTPKDDDNTKSYQELERGDLRFSLVVKDDYGVKDLNMHMDIDEMVEDKPLGNIYSENRLIMSQPNIEFKISPIYDMTWHTWAGLPVTFKYVVTDHKGQNAKLEKIQLTLPEREFEHPMAKSIIAMRKLLAWNYKDSFIEISKNLETLLGAPDYFQNRAVIYLTVRSASSRLLYADKYKGEKRISEAQEVIKLLWDIALSVEEGNLSLALRELRNAQRKLENVMRDSNSTESEISDIMDELREKMSNYFEELQRETQKRMANGETFPEMPAENFGSIISPDSLSKLMQEIESALKSGDSKKAQELMSQLQRMMEMINPSMMPMLPMDMQAMNKGINELQELVDRQEELLSQTTEQAKLQRRKSEIDKIKSVHIPSFEDLMKDLGMDNLPPPVTVKPQGEAQKQQQEKNIDKSNSRPNKIEQEALRYILGQLMLDVSEKIDEIPEQMGMAEQEMRLSSKALGDNKPQNSIPHQELAIKHLKDSQENLSKQFKQRMQQMVGIGSRMPQKIDPLGRQYGDEANDLGDVKIPDEEQKKRVDEILKTLRERSGEHSRPDVDLDYFRRLLRQF